jgi:hypothetical protein
MKSSCVVSTLALVAGAVAAPLGCGGSTDNEQRACTPGMQAQCTCPDGESGVYRCREDGSGYTECVCSEPAGSAGSASPDTGGAGSVCTPGDTRACIGPGACDGGQLCLPDGSWGACDCGTATGGSGGTGGVLEAGTGGTVIGGSGGILPGTGGTVTAGAGGTVAAGAGGIIAAGAGGMVTAGAAGSDTGGSAGTAGSGGLVVTGGSGGTEPCYGFSINAAGATGCVGTASPAVPSPVDLYVMLDRTSSMNEPLASSSMTRWEAVLAAFEQLAAEPEVQAARVGLGFFSYSASINEDVECNPANYAMPVVDILPLSDSGAAIVAAINDMAEWVSGLAPTYPALQGALQRAIDRQNAAARPVAVVFITDGLPTQCQPQDMQSVAALAEEGYLGFGVRTYAIGLGIGQWNLAQLARLGGTEEPYIIDQGDGATQLRDALLDIANSPSRCLFEVPDGADPDLLQVVFTPQAGAAEELPRLDGAELCSQSAQGGWYYDASVSPTAIRLCDCNCVRLPEGQLELRLGCEPRAAELG